MKNIVKTLGLIATVSAVSGADAATSRVSMTQAASRRLPSVAGHVVQVVTSSTGSTITTGSALLSNAECIDAYTGCLKAPDICGSDMEECTTNVLLHAQTPHCLSVLYQCSASGITALFGTSDITSLSNIAEQNSYGEVTRYTYPTSGSVLGQMVIGASIENMLPMDQCVRKYTNCLNRDSVCGEHFELCTSFNEFRKQSINCESIKARCQSDGLIELFGQTNTAVAPKATSRIGTAIVDGAQYAAANAVKTCYKVVDACLVNACTANPWRCVEGVNMQTVNAADFIAGGTTEENTTTSRLTIDQEGMITSDVDLYELTGQEVRKFIKGKCLSTIGGNKSCYLTFLEKTPKDKDLADIDNQEDVFSLAYGARKEYANTTIQDILKTFDKRAKTNCIKTISDCARSSCGGGLGSVCYQQARVDGGTHVNSEANYNEIMAGCEAIVNTNANCQYAAKSASTDGYIYQYADNSVFKKLFPQYDEALRAEDADPIGAVANLNALLATSYNDAAIAKMKKDCSNIAVSCVKSLCGTDYVNCYRNRTDVRTNVYDTGSIAFDKSMNKVGGVLDYTIVTGLCINSVKNADVCEEHLKIERVKLGEDKASPTWASGGVRNTWLTAAKSITADTTYEKVVVGCTSKTAGCNVNNIDACGTVDEYGCLYDQEVTQSWAEYSLTQAAENLFQEVLMDIEKEAQAKYNAKLTQEQHMCLSNNNGGIMGNRENGSTLLWVKLKSNKIPSNYPSKGLKDTQFVTSNDLYGSFCRARITVMSDDKDIQDMLGKDSVAYFAVGDSFTCGSWISRSTLDRISQRVGERAAKDAGKGSKKDAWWQAWAGVGGALLGGIGSYAAMDSIQQNGGTLGGLINPNKDADNAKTIKSNAESCLAKVESAKKGYDKAKDTSISDTDFFNSYNIAARDANSALDLAKKIQSKSGDKIEGLNISSFSDPVYTANGWQNESNIRNYLYKAKDCDVYKGTTTVTQDQDFRTAVSSIESLLSKASEENKNSINTYLTTIDTRKGTCNLGTKPTIEIKQITTTNSDLAIGLNRDKYLSEFNANIDIVEDYCRNHEDVEVKTSARRNRNLVAGAVGAIGGGVLTYKIVQNILEVKYENAENAAIKEWMDDVGSHIQCYLGGDELGSYGDVVSFSLD